MGLPERSIFRYFLPLAIFCIWSVAAAPASADMEGKKQLDDLIAKAKKEGVLNSAITSTIVGAEDQLKAAFKKRFGLDGIEINLARGSASTHFVKLHATLKSGGTPAFDALTGTGQEHMKLKEVGFSHHVDNWKTLLAEINPLVGSGKVKAEQVSPNPFMGNSFMWATRSRSYVYNTNRTTVDKIPRGVADMANPKYKGMFSVPPWSAMWEIGILVYDKNEWLKITDATGKNAAGVIRYGPAMDRMLLGEFSFQATNTYQYWQKKAKDPTVPLGQRWFTDYTPITKQLHVVPIRAQHPALGILWSMWFTTPEAQALWQPQNNQANAIWGQSEIDKEARKSLEDSGSKIVTWYDSPETIEKFKWFGTKEGQAYRAALTKALTQRGGKRRGRRRN